MQNTKTNTTIKEIMNKDFLIMPSSAPLIKCIKKMNHKHEAGLIMKNGNFLGIIGYDDIIREFIYGKNKEAIIENIKITKNFSIVNPELDVYKTILLIRDKDIEFILIKDGENFLGIVTKKELTKLGPFLFDNIEENNHHRNILPLS